MRSVLKQFTPLNCILLMIIASFIYFVLVPIFTVEVRVPLPPAASAAKAGEQKTEATTTPPPAQEYTLITEKNLFHSERILPPLKKEETSVPKPDFVLYGTLIVDNVRIAFMSDRNAPRTSPGRGKRQTALKLGASMSGYALKEVLSDRIIMVRGDDSIEVRVIAPGGKKERGTDAAPAGAPPVPQPHPVQSPRPRSNPRPLPHVFP